MEVLLARSLFKRNGFILRFAAMPYFQCDGFARTVTHEDIPELILLRYLFTTDFQDDVIFHDPRLIRG